MPDRCASSTSISRIVTDIVHSPRLGPTQPPSPLAGERTRSLAGSTLVAVRALSELRNKSKGWSASLQRRASPVKPGIIAAVPPIHGGRAGDDPGPAQLRPAGLSPVPEVDLHVGEPSGLPWSSR